MSQGVAHCVTASRVGRGAGVIASCLEADHNVFAFGNGGSSAIAGFLADALQARTRCCGYRGLLLKAPDVHFMQEVSSRTGFDYVFARTLDMAGRNGDGVVLVSASGNSRNCVEAARCARAQGITTLSLSAFDGGTLGRCSDHPFVFPVYDQQPAEDVMRIFAGSVVRVATGGTGDDPCGHGDRTVDALQGLPSAGLAPLALDVARAFVSSSRVFVWAPEGGELSGVCEHVAHNLQWDALSNLERPPLARIISMPSLEHFTGVTNDRDYRYTHSEQLRIYSERGDMLLLFAFEPHGKTVAPLLMEAGQAGLRTHLVTSRTAPNVSGATTHVLSTDDRAVFAHLCQVHGHLLGRVVRLALMLLGPDAMLGPDAALGLLIGCDLAQLRGKQIMNRYLHVRRQVLSEVQSRERRPYG